jgi:hypothetical protein
MSNKDAFNNMLIFKLSQIGFALYSTKMFTNRIKDIDDSNNDLEDLYSLQNNNSIFISITESNINYNVLTEFLKQGNLKLNFYLMQEPSVNKSIIEYLLPYAINIFCQNNDYNHSKVHCMPIGIRDCGSIVSIHPGFYHSYLYEEGLKKKDKTILCLLCFAVHQHIEDRTVCYELFKNCSFVLNLNYHSYENNPTAYYGIVPVPINYEYTHKSKYVLCPRGGGVDTHRFYEAIYLDSIPIVKRTNTVFDKLFAIFPCLVVEEWSQITEKFLEDNYLDCLEKLKTFKNSYPNAFHDLKSLETLLLNT